ncbi:RNA polymerase II transcription factor SIII subunit A-domain-containing protein [Xylariaceae sp. FL0804]|nr:RNA polymerase II transcription factor SIII subunit A-domain-containing protein [Xylariaceae sp. FL0804]
MVKSLVELCTVVCIKNVKDINDVGSTPYSVLRPILLKIDNAEQLRRLEVDSPHLEGDDAECWVRLIARHFPRLSKQHNWEPRNPSSWHKVYAKYQRVEAEIKREAAEKLKNAFKSIKKYKETNISTLVDYNRNLPRTPQDIKTWASHGSRPGGRRGGIDEPRSLKFTGGSRTKTNTAQSVMRKAYREAREIKARNRLDTPTGDLAPRGGQIKKAPAAMVQDHVHKSRPATGIRPPAPKRPTVGALDRRLEEREARLKKMKAADSSKGANYIDDEELESEFDLNDQDYDSGDEPGGLDESGLEALFDDEQPQPAPARSVKPASSARTGVLSRGPAPAPTTRAVPAPAKTKAQSPQKPSQASPAQSISPPLGPSSPPKGAESKPAMPRKRKAVDVFMRPKARPRQ